MWRNRLKYYANNNTGVLDEETRQRSIPRDWKEYRKVHWMQVLKTTATPCSCWMCRNYLYDRRAFKHETRRILREQEEDRALNKRGLDIS